MTTELTATAREILDAPDTIIANVMVREWRNLRVRLRSWTAADRIQFDAESSALDATLGGEEANGLLIPRAVAWSVIDDAGAWAFPRVGGETIRKLKTPEAVKAACEAYLTLARKNSAGLMRLWKIVAEHNGLLEDDEEDMEKN